MRIMNRNPYTIPSLRLQDDTNVAMELNAEKANALNSFFHGCFNYDFPTLTEFPDVSGMNYPAKDCPKQLLSTEASEYELLTTLDQTSQPVVMVCLQTC